MNLKDFEAQVALSTEDICREIFADRSHSIKIKKEKVVVRNLVRIFNATLTLANRKGFHAMSLRDLCRESGLSMGGLYAYFKTKDELLTLIQEQGRSIVRRVLWDRVKGIDGPAEKLAIAVRSHLYLSEVLQPWFFFSYMETRFFNEAEGKRAIEGELETERFFIDILEAGNERGDFTVDNPQLLAAAIKALLQDWYLKRWKYGRREIDVDAYADFVLSVIGTYAAPTDTAGDSP